MIMTICRYWRMAWFLVAFVFIVRAAPVHSEPTLFFDNYCMDCHDATSAKGGIDLEALSIADWDNKSTSDRWERVLKKLRKSEMTPPNEKQPSSEERETAVSKLHESLIKHSTSHDSVLRRLNTKE